MPPLKIRKGDVVQILTGKDRGKRGTVLESRPDERRLIVEGRNIAKRHTRPKPVKGTRGAQMSPGGVLDIEAPVRISNVGLVCPTCDKVTRVGTLVLEDGRRVRHCKKCQSQISEPKK